MVPTSRSSEGASTTDVAFRRGTTDDSKNCFSVMLESFVDLAKRIGAQGDADPDPDPEQGWTRLEPLYRLLGDHAAEWWVAEDALGGELVGYARSVARDGLFELTEFFPGELASLATYLCSDAASYVTGALIPVDGGLLRGL